MSKKHNKNTTSDSEMPMVEETAPQTEVTEEATPDTQETAPETPKEETEAERIQKLEFELAQSKDRFLRAKAEMDNYRKRVQRDLADVRRQTKTMTIEEFLSVFDHFQMAQTHAEQNTDFATLKQGMDMILNEFSRVFENLGVLTVNAVNQPFDPNEHEALAEEASAEVPAGHVLRQWKCGFRMGERLLRPASVIVSSGPADEPEVESDDSDLTENSQAS
jgi:molecular chaperone GrpE